MNVVNIVNIKTGLPAQICFVFCKTRQNILDMFTEHSQRSQRSQVAFWAINWLILSTLQGKCSMKTVKNDECTELMLTILLLEINFALYLFRVCERCERCFLAMFTELGCKWV